MTENRLKIQWVSPKELVENTWNTNIVSPENEDKIDKSIDKFGIFKPTLVRTLDNGDLEIIGGAHRTQSAIRQSIDSVPIVNLGRISDIKAQEIGLVDNGRYGSDDSLMLSELLQSISKHDDVSSFLPFSDDELSSIFTSSIALDDLEFGDEEDEPELPDAGTPAKIQTHQIMRFKVPVEDAEAVTEIVEKIMREQNFTEGDSLVNAGDALVYLCQPKSEKD